VCCFYKQTSHSKFSLVNPFSCWVVFVVSTWFPILEASQQKMFFMGLGCQPNSQPPTWRSRVPLFVWAITFHLSGLGCYCQHCSQDHLITQVPPLHQSRDTFGRMLSWHNIILLKASDKNPRWSASALDEGEWSASHPWHFIPRQRTPVTRRAGLGDLEKRKIKPWFHTGPFQDQSLHQLCFYGSGMLRFISFITKLKVTFNWVRDKNK